MQLDSAGGQLSQTKSVVDDQKYPMMQLTPLEGETIHQIDLDDIVPDPKQPRKTFDQRKHLGMVKSIEAGGEVIQPILLRPSLSMQGKYMLVHGERRFNASVAVREKHPERRTIRAVIRYMSDEQAAAIQLNENEHREEVHVMEQARKYLSMATEFSIELDEVALRTGTSETHVKRYFKLNDLIPQWQELFLKNAIKYKIAMMLCQLPAKTQKEILKECVSEKELAREQPKVNVDTHTLRRWTGDLGDAIFDLDDKELIPKAGACSSCRFNSRAGSLFTDERHKPICNKLSCFEQKTSRQFEVQLKKSIEDPAIVLIAGRYSSAGIIDKLTAEGHKVLRTDGKDCEIIKEPKKETYEEYVRLRSGSEAEKKKAYAEYEMKHEKAVEAFVQKVEQGVYLKAFRISNVDGTAGTYAYVLIRKKTQASSDRAAVLKGGGTKEQVQQEIKRLEERETRSKERDREIVQEKMVAEIKEKKVFHKMPQSFTKNDQVVINFLLLEALQYSGRDMLIKLVPALKESNTAENRYAQLEQLAKPQLAMIARSVLLQNYASRLPKDTGAYLLRKVAEGLREVPIKALEAAQKVVSGKREPRVKTRIEVLEKQLKALSDENETNKSGKVSKPKLAAKKTRITKSKARKHSNVSKA